MHFERLAIEAGANTFTLDFHERLTVIAGMGRLERDGLVNELVGGLGTGRAGVHLEVRSDAGERYAIFRPSTGTPRVVDIERATDVTNRFTNKAGQINILERSGLTLDEARQSMRITPADLTTRSQGDEYVDRLARVDPNRLWDVARKVLEAEARLAEAAEAVGSVAEDVGAFEEIERRHVEFEAAQVESENARHLTFLIAACCAMGALPGLLLVGPMVAFPLLMAAGLTGTFSLTAWMRSDAARRQEEAALAAVGERSYLSFQVSRVNELVATESQRKRLMHTAADHRAATAQWDLLAGEIQATWALEHRREIAEAHSRLRASLGAGSDMTLALGPRTATAAHEVGQTVSHVLARIRHLGAGGESFPTFLDDPFLELPADQKREVLALVSRTSAEQQIVLLTSDPEVVDWARLEAISGDLSLVEPAGHSRAGDGPTTKRSRHVAA